jgi:hypothetical protein
MRKYEQHQEENGKPQSHKMAKEIAAGMSPSTPVEVYVDELNTSLYLYIQGSLLPRLTSCSRLRDSMLSTVRRVSVEACS